MGLELRIFRDPCRQVAKSRVRVFGVDGGGIGRALDNYWVLPDPKRYVSGQHCAVEYRAGTFWLRDLSRNGVFLNGAREPIGQGKAAPLRDGDHVQVAEYELVAKVDENFMRPTVQDGPKDQRPRLDRRDELGRESGVTSINHGEDTGEHAKPAVIVSLGSVAKDFSAETQNLKVNEGEATPTDAPEPEADAQTPDSSADWAGSTHPHVEADPEDESDSGTADDKDAQENPAPSLLYRMTHPGWKRSQPGVHRFRSKQRSDRSSDKVGKLPTFKPATVDPEATERHGILLGVSDAAALRAYKILRTRLRRSLAANHWRSVGVTGEGPGVGKTVTVTNLAIAFAQDARFPVFLVDLDLHRPKVNKYLGMNAEAGLTDYLLGDADLADIIYSPGVEGLSVIPNSRPLESASELLASPRMQELVQFVESQQPEHVILYDLPPLLMSDDVLVFAPFMDCVLNVVGAGVTSRAGMDRSMEILSELNLVGVVLNMADEQDVSGYSYYY